MDASPGLASRPYLSRVSVAEFTWPLRPEPPTEKEGQPWLTLAPMLPPRQPAPSSRYQHPLRLSARIRAQQRLVPPAALARAWQAQIRVHQRHRHLTANGKRPTVAVARELCGFLWATMTRQPPREEVLAA
jgi:hypothetical protein